MIVCVRLWRCVSKPSKPLGLNILLPRVVLFVLGTWNGAACGCEDIMAGSVQGDRLAGDPHRPVRTRPRLH
jgi:hypothetical protein